MPSEFETGFVGRVPAWHGLGIVVKDSLSSAEALKVAELDWKVMSKKIQVGGGKTIPGYKANVRDRDKKVLGVVSDRYKVVQPAEAFEFTDELLKNSETRYETAGSLYGGKRIWLLASLPSELIVGAEVQPFIFFSTTFDGSTPTICGMTPTVIVCANTLSYAVNSAKRTWVLKHTSSIKDKVEEAQRTLGLAGEYMRSFKADAEELAQKTLAISDVQKIVEQIFPMDEDSGLLMSKRQKDNVEFFRDQFWQAWRQPDLDNYNVLGKPTGWTVLQAFADVASHLKPLKETATFAENRFAALMDGNKLLGKVHEILGEIGK